MARMPGAVWRELPENRTQDKITPTQLILHSAVAKAETLFGYFSQSKVTLESHFYMQGDGDLEQYIDTGVRADANYRASVRAISVETWDNLQPDQLPWTPAQMNKLVELAVWAHRTHGIPLRRCRTATDPGIGGHSDYPGEWTNVRGKTCPGLARRPQVAEVIARAIVIVNGRPAPAPAPVPPKPAPSSTVEVNVAALPLLKEGARGTHVKIVQGCLIAHNHNLQAEGGMDGVFGPGLTRELKAFQNARGLGGDGIVGPNTWKRLIGA